MPLTLQKFVSEWKRVTVRDKQTYQEHFIMGAGKTSRWDGNLTQEEALELLLMLNVEHAKK